MNKNKQIIMRFLVWEYFGIFIDNIVLKYLIYLDWILCPKGWYYIYSFASEKIICQSYFYLGS